MAAPAHYYPRMGHKPRGRLKQTRFLLVAVRNDAHRARDVVDLLVQDRDESVRKEAEIYLRWLNNAKPPGE